MDHKIKVNFEDFWLPYSIETVKNYKLYKLLSGRFDLEVSNNPDFLIYSCCGKDFLKYDCTRIFYTGENVRPNFDECDYAFSFDYPITENNYRLPNYRLCVEEFEKIKNRQISKDDLTYCERKFCNFLYSNDSAKERIDFFRELARYKHIDSGGKVLNNLGHRIRPEDRLSFLGQYKFTIAFENSSYPGYTTEKIQNAFAANTVPIYWGNPLVADEFNPNAFINCHDYDSFDKVIERVIELDQDDTLYMEYLSQPVFSDKTSTEYLQEEKIFERFEKIFFSNNNRSRVAKKTDKLKYVWYQLMFRAGIFRRLFRPLRHWLRRLINSR